MSTGLNSQKFKPPVLLNWPHLPKCNYIYAALFCLLCFPLLFESFVTAHFLSTVNLA